MGLEIKLVFRGGGGVNGAEIITHYTTREAGFTISERIMLFNSDLTLFKCILVNVLRFVGWRYNIAID